MELEGFLDRLLEKIDNQREKDKTSDRLSNELDEASAVSKRKS